MGLAGYLVVSALLFSIGAFGFLARRNAILMLICIELMLNSVNLSLVAFNAYAGPGEIDRRHLRPDDHGRRRRRGDRRPGTGHRHHPHPSDPRGRRLLRPEGVRHGPMELLIALIPALPLAGFLFAVLVGPRLDRVPLHGTARARRGARRGPPRARGRARRCPRSPRRSRRTTWSRSPPRSCRRETSPHAGHADDLANAAGADGVIPDDLNDGIGQSGHVTPGGPQPVYRSWIVPVALVAITWVISMVVFANVIFGGNELHVTLYRWIPVGDFQIDIAFQVDALTAMLLLVVSTVGLLVHVYSIGYMNGDRGFWRFFAYLNLFMFSMLLLILGDNFLMLYVGWEAVGLCSYALIGFWYKKPSAAGAAKKAFIVNRIGDFGFGLGIMMIWTLLGTLNFADVFATIGVAARSGRSPSSPCSSSPARSASAPSSRSTSGCRTRWRAPPRSAP